MQIALHGIDRDGRRGRLVERSLAVPERYSPSCNFAEAVKCVLINNGAESRPNLWGYKRGYRGGVMISFLLIAWILR